MIDRTEILRLANTLGLEARVIEKDYVLGWVLHGIARDPVIGPVHLYRCPLCGKRFERKTDDGTLRAHMNPQGWSCSGRSGIYEGTK